MNYIKDGGIRKVKITKSQLKQIIYHEIKRSLNESNGEEEEEDKFRQTLLRYLKPDKEKLAFDRLMEVFGLIEKTILYMIDKENNVEIPTGISPVSVLEILPPFLLGEEEAEKKVEELLQTYENL